MTIKLWWALLAVFISCLAMMAGSLIYANSVARESAQQWCSIVITLDDAYRQTPPQTAVGQNLASEIAQLRQSLECKGVRKS